MNLPLLLLSSALASDIVDVGGMGAALLFDDQDTSARGISLALLDADFNLAVMWGKDPDDTTHVQSWGFDVGRWGPTLSLDEEAPPEPTDQSIEERLRNLTQNASGKAFLTVPRMLVGGFRPGGERFHLQFDGDEMWNLLAYTNLPVRKAYLGPLVGAGMGVLYHSKTSDLAPEGTVRLNAGLAMGGALGGWLHGRVQGRVHLDPFENQDHTAEADAALGLSFLDMGLPLGLQALGTSTAPLSDLGQYTWSLTCGILLVADTED